MGILSDIVHKYRQSKPRQDELKFFRKLPTLESAIHFAALAIIDDNGTMHCHQNRIRKVALEEAHRILLSGPVINNISQAKDLGFDALFTHIKGSCSKITGIGELYIYDTSLRIGAKLNLMPEKVYLHRGTRVGARNFGLNYKANSLELSELPAEFRKLEPYEIEDVLCIYQHDLLKAGLKHKKCNPNRHGCCG